MPFNRVEIKPKELAPYKPLIGNALYSQIRKKAQKLAGLRVAVLNATAAGGGVVELFLSLIPLLNDVGVKTSWYTLTAPEEFFEITKKIHNLLQGQKGSLTEKEKEFYLEQNRHFATALAEVETDIWIVHDPQPAALILHSDFRPMIWHCHLDTSSSGQKIWDFFSFIKNYDKYIFSLKEYANSHLNTTKTCIFPPAIDPLSPKNWPIDPFLADSYLATLGVDPARPIITQISRFDPWKDPLGVIQSYRLAKKELPGLQLILTGEMAADDPEGVRIFGEVQEAAGCDPDIYLWADNKRSDLKINAIQVASDVILQKSLKEGFGLTVTEAMWKGKVIVGGNCGGIRLQIKDGVNGFLVDSPRQASERVIWVLKNPQKAKEIGRRAKDSVRRKFLMPRLLDDYLSLLTEALPQILTSFPSASHLRLELE
ncbi:MAG: glycosyltransferase [bacterium]|nr:glycosyltransferase [bacterium]